ncbi:MAG TPA: hypothetical protein VF357_00795, partial [Candidatus Deferrimicrobium sp.]
MKNTGRNIPRLIEGFGGVLLLILGVALPVLYFVNRLELESEHLRTETAIYARLVSSVITRNPDLWMYETTRLEGLLAKGPEDNRVESVRILDEDGTMVMRREERLAWPLMTRTHPLMDSDMIVGSLEESTSLRPLIVETSILAMAGTGITALLFFLFRTYPIAALRNALDLLSREKGRAKVTLQSIGDGVI